MITGRFEDAFRYACIVHGAQRKKGSDAPYVAHLMDVTALVLTYGGGEDEAIGALLHDAAEDADGRPRLDDIRGRFGDRVAEIVEGCADTFEDPKPAWLPRKTAYIEHLPQVSAPTRLVSACDKLANVRTLIADLKEHGDVVWSRFSGGRQGTVWYYRRIADEFLRLGPLPVARRLDEHVAELQRLARLEGPADSLRPA